VAVSHDALAQRGFAHFLALGLRISEEKALVAAESVERGCGLTGKGLYVCSMGDSEPTHVCNVLAQGLLAVEV
jgi:hypothetical protein